MNLQQSLANVLRALRSEIGPQLSSPRASATLGSVVNVLTHLLVNATASDSGRCAPATASRDHAAPRDGEQTSIYRSLIDEASVPYGHFGGKGNYARLQARVEAILDSNDPQISQEVANLIAWEKSAIDRTVLEVTKLLEPMSTHCELSASSELSRLRQQALETYLRTKYPCHPSLHVCGFAPLPGGRSKSTALVQLAGCQELPPEFILRQDAALNATGGPSVIGEFALLRELHRLGMKVAQPFTLERSPAVLGAPFVLMEKLRGGVASGLLQPPYSRRVALSLAGELAKLHSIPLSDNQAVTADHATFDRAAKLLELERFGEPWREPYQPPCLAVRVALKWLRDNIDLAVQGTPALIHGDPLFHNVLAAGDELTGLLDWEFAKVGYPAEDLGWIRAAVEGRLPWAEFMDAYRATGGPNLSREQLDYYAVWEALRLTSMLARSNRLAASGSTQDIEYTCVAFHETYIARQWLSASVARVAGA